MPEKLHDPSTAGISFIRVDDPLPDLDIILPRTHKDLVSRHSKLCATCGTHIFGHAKVFLIGGDLGGVLHRVQFGSLACIQCWGAGPLEDIRPHLLRHMLVLAMTFLAPGVPIASKVDVAVLLDEIELKSAHCSDIVVQWRIDMPCQKKSGPMRVEEGYGRGKVFVVVDHVGQIGHGLMAFVEGSREHLAVVSRDAGRVHDVDRTLPTVFQQRIIVLDDIQGIINRAVVWCTYSGSSSSTQLVFSSSNLAMTITLSPTWT